MSRDALSEVRSNSARRLAALEQYGILDTDPEECFDDLVRLASYICRVPIALSSLLDLDRQWFKARVGQEATETPLEQSFCAHAVSDDHVFVVPDARKDARFAQNPLVIGRPEIRFYAGARLVSPEGVPLGTICAIDSNPRELDAEQQTALQALARQVVRLLELRKAARALTVALKEKEEADREVAALQELLPMCAWCRKVRDDESFWQSVEDYVSHRGDICVSHGVCPECAQTLKNEMRRAPSSLGS